MGNGNFQPFQQNLLVLSSYKKRHFSSPRLTSHCSLKAIKAGVSNSLAQTKFLQQKTSDNLKVEVAFSTPLARHKQLCQTSTANSFQETITRKPHLPNERITFRKR